MTLRPSRSFLKLAALFLILSLGPASIYVLYNRTGGPESQKERAFQRKLRLALMAGTEYLDVAPLTDWPWVSLCALDSGLTQGEADAVLGFHYRDFQGLRWPARAEYWTILFVDSERETNWGRHRPVTAIRIPRADLADLSLPPGQKGACVPAATGRLKLTRHEAPVGRTPVTAELAAVAQ